MARADARHRAHRIRTRRRSKSGDAGGLPEPHSEAHRAERAHRHDRPARTASASPLALDNARKLGDPFAAMTTAPFRPDLNVPHVTGHVKATLKAGPARDTYGEDVFFARDAETQLLGYRTHENEESVAKGLLLSGLLLFASCIAACAPARPPPKSNAPVGVARSTVDDPARAAATCVEPKMDLSQAKKREEGIDAFLAGRVSDAIGLLDEVVRSDPRDRAADVFRRGTIMKLDARKEHAREELKMITPVALEAVPLVRTNKKPIPGVTGSKLRLEKES